MTAVAHDGPAMTQAHVEGLLGLLVALDARMKAPDAATAALRVKAWAALLQEVEPTYAMRHAELAYQVPRDWPLQPAEILVAWRTEQAEARAAADAAYRQAHPGGRATATAMADWVREALRVAAAGGDVAAIPRPIMEPLSPERDAYERRCQHWQLCACPHTDCREGILDDETTITGPSGLTYPAVKRCPWCQDALTMAEDQGHAKRPHRGGGRRR